MTTFLALMLTLNNFVFECIHYFQIKGCAVATICALAYVNISMACLELRYIYPYLKDITKMFLRFIDDLFIIWKGSEQELLDSMSVLNKKHPSINMEKEKHKIRLIHVLFYFHKISDVSPFTKGIIKLL